ncbi:Pol Polyprotein [Phytophthora megakarya]|uniref:Pol Polyprotein n=1 Tax=Phytophthora megakarya TaxID=4795 RepID=A0A225WWB4_9STRA|nr:Pol Polyprotein [Phytophthora megakarya]
MHSILSRNYPKMPEVYLDESYQNVTHFAPATSLTKTSNTSAADYLVLMTDQQPFTPLPTRHAVIIDSRTYCSTVAMCVVINSFLQDHGNAVVKELLSNYEVAMIEKFRSLKNGETVKYFGAPFINLDTSTQLATQLDEKLMPRLRLWKGRARTLMGRRLIVQVVILSILWYFTTVVNIPVRFLNLWQSVVTRYILYNRVGTEPGGINIVKKGLATRRQEDDGIGVPILTLSIRRQRYTLLQQLI